MSQIFQVLIQIVVVVKRTCLSIIVISIQLPKSGRFDFDRWNMRFFCDVNFQVNGVIPVFSFINCNFPLHKEKG